MGKPTCNEWLLLPVLALAMWMWQGVLEAQKHEGSFSRSEGPRGAERKPERVDEAIMTDLTLLLQEWQSIDTDIHQLEIERHRVETAIKAEMDATRASFAEIPGVEAKVSETVEYNRSLDGPLQRMAEELSPADLDGLLTVPKPPPERAFDMRKVKLLAKRGGVFRDALDAATVTLPATLKVRAVKK